MPHPSNLKTQKSPVILDSGKSHENWAQLSQMFSVHTRKRKAGVFKKAPFSWRISVDTRNKTAFSNFSGVEHYWWPSWGNETLPATLPAFWQKTPIMITDSHHWDTYGFPGGKRNKDHVSIIGTASPGFWWGTIRPGFLRLLRNDGLPVSEWNNKSSGWEKHLQINYLLNTSFFFGTSPDEK